MSHGEDWGSKGQGMNVDIAAGVVVVEGKKVLKGLGLVLKFLKVLKVVLIGVWS